jgi:O-antigen/teichoic acid export membrane protein
METGYFRYASSSKESGKIYTTVLSALFVTSTAFIIFVLISGSSLASLIGYAEHPEYIRWLAVIVGVDAFTALPFARIRLRNKPVKYAIIRIIEVSVNIGLNLFFLWYCPRHSESELVSILYNGQIGVGYVLISNMLASLVKLLLLSGELLAAFKNSFSRVLLKKILRYSSPLLVAGLAGTVNEAIDRILLKHLIPADQLPMEQLGIYGANFKMAVLMTLFVQMFKYAAEPFFFSRSKDKNARELYADVMNFFVAAGLVIFLLVNLYMEYFILFIGQGFREGAQIVPIILMANLVMGIFFNLSIWYKLTNKTMYGAVLVIIGALVTVLINVLFIPRYGYVASAWAHLICYSLMVLLSYFWSRKHYKVPYKTGRIVAYMVVALMIYYFNELLLQDIGPVRDLTSLILLGGFGLFLWYMERPVFIKYKNMT